MRQGIEGDGTFYSNGAIHCDEANQLPVCIVFRIVQVEFQNHAGLHLQKIGCRSIRSLAREGIDPPRSKHLGPIVAGNVVPVPLSSWRDPGFHLPTAVP
jgi:hypothetical protein